MNATIIPFKPKQRPINVYPGHKWVVRYAWLPVKTEDCGWVWAHKYQVLLEEGWSGGVTGGYTWYRLATVLFRTSVLLREVNRPRGKA